MDCIIREVTEIVLCPNNMNKEDTFTIIGSLSQDSGSGLSVGEYTSIQTDLIIVPTMPSTGTHQP
jgi:hypothetical protein